MKNFSGRIRRALTSSRTVVGVVLIVASILGTVFAVRAATPGDRIVLAMEFIPAGTVVTVDMVREGRVSDATASTTFTVAELAGKVLAVDVGEGEVLSTRMFEPATTDRARIAVPLGVAPPAAIERGTDIHLWAVDPEGIAPPVAVATHATVESVTESGFGGDVVLTILVGPAEVDRVLAVLGAAHVLVATSGETL